MGTMMQVQFANACVFTGVMRRAIAVQSEVSLRWVCARPRARTQSRSDTGPSRRKRRNAPVQRTGSRNEFKNFYVFDRQTSDGYASASKRVRFHRCRASCVSQSPLGRGLGRRNWKRRNAPAQRRPAGSRNELEIFLLFLLVSRAPRAMTRYGYALMRVSCSS